MHMNKFVLKDGARIIVLRPKDALLAVELAKAFIGNAEPNFLNFMLAVELAKGNAEPNFLNFIEGKCGPLTNVGFLGVTIFNKHKLFIIDKDRKKIDEIQVGDFFSIEKTEN